MIFSLFGLSTRITAPLQLELPEPCKTEHLDCLVTVASEQENPASERRIQEARLAMRAEFVRSGKDPLVYWAIADGSRFEERGLPEPLADLLLEERRQIQFEALSILRQHCADSLQPGQTELDLFRSRLIERMNTLQGRRNNSALEQLIDRVSEMGLPAIGGVWTDLQISRFPASLQPLILSAQRERFWRASDRENSEPDAFRFLARYHPEYARLSAQRWLLDLTTILQGRNQESREEAIHTLAGFCSDPRAREFFLSSVGIRGGTQEAEISRIITILRRFPSLLRTATSEGSEISRARALEATSLILTETSHEEALSIMNDREASLSLRIAATRYFRHLPDRGLDFGACLDSALIALTRSEEEPAALRTAARTLLSMQTMELLTRLQGSAGEPARENYALRAFETLNGALANASRPSDYSVVTEILSNEPALLVLPLQHLPEDRTGIFIRAFERAANAALEIARESPVQQLSLLEGFAGLVRHHAGDLLPRGDGQRMLEAYRSRLENLVLDTEASNLRRTDLIRRIDTSLAHLRADGS